MTISIERLRECFDYDPEAGRLTWKISPSARARKGSEAGSPRKGRPYRLIRLDGCHLYTHRVIWAMTSGAWPSHVIDHINGDPKEAAAEAYRQAAVRLFGEFARTDQ